MTLFAHSGQSAYPVVPIGNPSLVQNRHFTVGISPGRYMRFFLGESAEVTSDEFRLDAENQGPRSDKEARARCKVRGQQGLGRTLLSLHSADSARALSCLCASSRLAHNVLSIDRCPSSS
jgi:hypothetical protein